MPPDAAFHLGLHCLPKSMKTVKLTPACATTETICIYKEKKRCEADCVGLRLLFVHMIYLSLLVVRDSVMVMIIQDSRLESLVLIDFPYYST